MSVRTYSTTLLGVDAIKVEVETQIIIGLKRFSIVGLPDGVVKEAKDRVKCALENSGFEFPNCEVIVSLAPASLPKIGSGFDLAIAVSVLAANSAIPQDFLGKNIFVGELALDGRIKQTGAELASAYLIKDQGLKSVLYVSEDAKASLEYFPDFNVRYVDSLSNLITRLQLREKETTELPIDLPPVKRAFRQKDFSDVVGQYSAKRALQVAAAGGHNVLLVGPPGGGKTMLAERLPSILPEFSKQEFLEVNKIHSCLHGQRSMSSNFNPIFERQFRAPHHSISMAGLIGGGANVLPGEITLAHFGILFLDELPELRRDSLEALREPLEKGKISISRAQSKFTFPAEFLLVAAMNPCPCGKRGLDLPEDRTRTRYKTLCNCSDQEVKKYVKKLSGPLLDRIDIQLWVPQVSLDEMNSSNLKSDETEKLKQGIRIAREIQAKRFLSKEKLNSKMATKELFRNCELDDVSTSLLKESGKKFHFSARAFTRILKISRTIADLDRSESIREAHLVEALSYRMQIG